MIDKEIYLHSIKLLSKKDYSIHKLTQKLLLKGHNECDIDEVIDVLIEKRFLNEKNYTKNRMQSLVLKFYSDNFIAQKLESEKLEFDLNVLEEIRYEEKLTQRAAIAKLFEKKLRILSKVEFDQKNKQKLISFMFSKGYSFEQIEAHIPNSINDEF